MALDRETAFFNFDTNADTVAANIEGAMRRINSALAQGSNLDRGQLAADTAGLGQMFTRLQTDLDRSVGQIRNLLGQVGSGALSPQQFQAEFQGLVRNSVGRIPTILADELALAPQSVASRIDAQAIGRQVAQDYVDSLIGAVRSHRGDVGDALRGMRFERRLFVDDVANVQQQPVAYGQETTRLQQLVNQVRAEQLALQMLKGEVSRDQVMRAGFGPSVASVVTSQIEFGEQGGIHFRDSGARAELQEIVRAEREAEATALRLGRAREREAIATEQLAAAERLLAGEATKVGSRYIDGDGNVFRTTTSGAVPEDNPLRIEDAETTARRLQQEVENGQRLLREWDQVMRVGSYHVLGRGTEREVFRITNAGAEQITTGVRLRQVLEDHDDLLQRQVQHAQRLNELDGRRIAQQERANSGLLGGFLGRFHRGEQSITTGLGGQIASAAAFSFAYGSLFAAQAAIRDTVNEVMDYQDSLTDLEVATRSADVVTGDWVNTLSQLSRLSGSNVGASLDAAARGVRAFGDAAGSTPDQMREIGTATTEAATQLALIASKDLRDATGDTIAIGTAFGLDPDQLNQVVDAVANAKRTLGGDPAQIAQGLSLIANTAQEAGFTLSETASVISLVQARTDQSGQAIATRLSRIFQIISGSTGKGLARELGVDSSQNVRDQIADFAEIYSAPDASEAVRDRISSALGGTANLREILPLLEEQPRLQAAYAEALANTGAGTDEFNRKTENLVGTLKQIVGTVRNIQVDLARSGLFTPFGAAIEVLEPALNGLDRMIRLYDELTGKMPGLQEVLGITLNIALAAKAISMVQSKGLLFAGGAAALDAGGDLIDETLRSNATRREVAAIEAGTRARAAAEARMTGTVAAATQGRAAAEGVGAAASGRGRFAGLAAVGRGIFNPVTLGIAAVVGSLWAFNEALESTEQIEEFRADRASGLAAFSRIDGSSGSFRSAAGDLRSTAGEVMATDAAWGNADVQQWAARNLRSQSRALDILAERVQEEEQLAAAAQQLTVFGDGAVETVSELGEGLTTLAESGANARTQMRLLIEQLTSTPTPETENPLTPGLSADITASVFGVLRESIPAGVRTLRTSDPEDLAAVGAPFDPYERQQLLAPATIEQALNSIPTGQRSILAVDRAVQAKITELGLAIGDPLTPDQQQALLRAAIDALDLSKLPEHREEIAREAFDQAMLDLGFRSGNPFADHFNEILDPNEERRRLLNGRGALDRDQLLTLLNPSEDGSWAGLPAIHQADVAGVPASDDGTIMERVQQDYLKLLRRLASRYEGDELDALNDEIAAAEFAVAEAAIARLEQARKVAQSASGLNRKEIRQIGRDSLMEQVLAAGDQASLLIEIMERADQTSLDIVEKKLEEAARIAAAAAALNARVVAYANHVRGQAILEGSVPGVAPPTQEEKDLDAFRDARGNAVVTADPFGGMAGGEGAAIYDPKKDAAAEKLTAAQRAALLAQAQVDPDNTIATAAANLQVARANLSAADKNTQEYYSALQAVTSAEDAYAKAVAGHASAAAQATAARVGGQIAAAQASLAAATAQLNATAAGTTGYFQALASFYQAQQQMRDAVLSHQAVLDQLDGDITDPVEQATDTLTAARRRLRTNRRAGMAEDVLAADELAVEQAKAAAEQARFNQRFQDAQTANELGRISHQAYMRYLDNEHDRLSAIKNRTRQQQDMLDQVTAAIKAASDQMQGQFNLGDINTNGLVYQARRYAAEQRADRARQSAEQMQAVVNQQTDVRIQIDGADVAKVRRIIEQYVGQAARTRTTQPRRR